MNIVNLVMAKIVLRRITKKGWALTNFCWYETKYGNPMVCSTFCDTYCPHYK